MFWYLFAACAALMEGGKQLVHRFVMRTANPWSYALVENAGAAILFLPLLFTATKPLPGTPVAWLLVLASAGLWSVIAVLGHLSYRYTPVSLKTPLSQTRVLWVFLLSALFLSEAITSAKIFGTLFVFTGTALLTYRKTKLFGKLSDRGVQLTLLVAFLAACVAIIDKRGVAYFDPAVYGFLVYALPAFIIFFAVVSERKRRRDTRVLLRTNTRAIAAMLLLTTLAYYASLKAYALADASLVFPIIRTSTIVSVLFGGVLFHEDREEIIPRVLAAIVIVGGVLLLSGYFV